ncbi:DUF1273 domain-containing protein [Oscillospiraceae bacterium OttesenSCG-928-G22]|nr:DUF1273 domain-containing protein [Oscillospiraceae bacterium OttesenSCG-928-G22]
MLRLYRGGVTRFLSGGALGYDAIASFATLEAKRTYPDIELWMIIPFKGQAARWGQRDRRIHERLMAVADHVVCLSETYLHGCYHTRNRWLVDNAAHVVAYYTGKEGGTAYTLSYAIENGLAITNVDELRDAV